jgi:hypothetical protein
MRTSNLRRLLARLTAIAAVAGATAASANTMNVCVDKEDGDMRVVLSSRFCHRNEASLTLAVCADSACNDFRGPAGAAGPQGAAGAVGPVGPTGDIGAVGPQGAAGPQGNAGPMGPMGLAGPQGAVGAQGNAGPVGAAGPQGPKGDTGAAGAQGPQGVAGAQGPQGVAGAMGPQGFPGPMGPQGPAGSTPSSGNGSVVANADSNFARQPLHAGLGPVAMAAIDLTPGNWVIVGKAMVTALSKSTTAEASCTLVSGTVAMLDSHSVAMTVGVHNTVTVAAPFTVTGSADGRIELQCETVDLTEGALENAQLWAVQVGTLNTSVTYPPR